MISKTQQEFLLGALVAGVLGAAVTLLLTPSSGAQIRRKLRTGFGYLNGKKAKKSAHAAHRYSLNGHNPRAKKAARPKRHSAARSNRAKS